MKTTAIRTHKITIKDQDINLILDKYISSLSENTVVVIASKIVAICEGRVASLTDQEKDELIIKESQYYLPKEQHKFKLFLTIKENFLTYSSGLDESNGNGKYVLWPKDPQKSSNKIREYLRKKHNLKNLGVIITDMAAIPLQFGVIAGAIAYSGLKPFKDLTGTEDLFGKPFKYSNEGIVQGLAASAGVVMGEGSEQTPLATIEDIPFVEFIDQDPSKEELDSLKIGLDQDLYGPLISAVEWKKGGNK